MTTRTLVLAPHLPLAEPVTIGEWFLGPPDEHRWVEEGLERAALRLLEKYTSHADPPAIISLSGEPVGATPLKQDVVVPLQATLLYVGLHGNPDVDAGGWAPSRAVTADNLILEGWTIDPDEGWLSTSRGSLVQVHNLGLRLEDPDSRIPVPLEIVHPEPLSLDVELASTLLAHLSESGRPDRSGLMSAIWWLVRAWRNTDVLDRGPRVVFLRTGFEALLPSEQPQSARRLAKSLRDHFERFAQRVGLTGQSDELLWSPDERPCYEHPKAKGLVSATEHWFLSFSDRRNEIVHEGVADGGRYEGPAERFVGEYFWVGERVLREAISTLLSDEEQPDLWREADSRRIRRHALEWLEDRGFGAQ